MSLLTKYSRQQEHPRFFRPPVHSFEASIVTIFHESLLFVSGSSNEKSPTASATMEGGAAINLSLGG